MRPIKFRAQTIANGEWVTGSYVRLLGLEARIYFLSGIWTLVDPETVGEYTGLKDKNEVEIYEGDIVNDTLFPDRNYTVEFRVESSSFCFREITNSCWLAGSHDFVEVIGNIHQHPELLKEGE